MPKLPAALERELGHVADLTATQGFPWDPSEHTPELQWPQSVRVWDQMRTQDAQIRGVLRALTLPLIRAQWQIDPAGARPDVAQRIADDLGLPLLGQAQTPPVRLRDRFSWTHHLELALLSLPLGYIGFEQVYRIDGDGLARLAKLSPRMPLSIAKIDVEPDGSLKGIQQYGLGVSGSPSLIEIPVSRLVWYANEREGGNWQGRSILRSVYKNWLLKDRLLRVQAMTIERNGMGVPVVTAGPNATPQQMAEANQMAQEARAGEYSGGALPGGFTMTFQGVQGRLPDALPAVEYHDSQIAKNVLAQFLDLGRTATGSRALGESFVDFFVLALEAVGAQIASVVNEHVIEDLVDLNWGESEPAPRIVPSAPGEHLELSPTDLVALVTAGVVSPDADLESYMRDRYKLPGRIAEDSPGGKSFAYDLAYRILTINERRAQIGLPPIPGGDVPPEPPAPTGGGGGGGVAAAARRRAVRAATDDVSTTVADRRAALYERAKTAQHSALAALLEALDVDAMLDDVASVAVVQAAAGDDPVVVAVESALTTAGQATPDLLDATTTAIHEATAEGATGAKGLLMQARESTVIDFDIEFTEQLSALADLETLTAAAEPWVAKQLQGLAFDLGGQLAKLMAAGATREQMANTVTAALGSPRGAELFLDNAIAGSLTDGAVDLYTTEGVDQIDFLTTEDARVDEDCADAASGNPWPIADCPRPPLHLGCRCAVAVVAG